MANLTAKNQNLCCAGGEKSLVVGTVHGIWRETPAPSSMTGVSVSSGMSCTDKFLEAATCLMMQISSHGTHGQNSWAICCAEVLNCSLSSHINSNLLAHTALLDNWILNLIRGALQRIRYKEPSVSLYKRGTSGSFSVCGSSWEVPEWKQIPHLTPCKGNTGADIHFSESHIQDRRHSLALTAILGAFLCQDFLSRCFRSVYWQPKFTPLIQLRVSAWDKTKMTLFWNPRLPPPHGIGRDCHS